jgi:hypothetical protein
LAFLPGAGARSFASVFSTPELAHHSDALLDDGACHNETNILFSVNNGMNVF